MPVDGGHTGQGERPERSPACCARLRVLAIGEPGPTIRDAAAQPAGALDERCRSLLRLAALLTTGGGSATFDRYVADAFAAGAGADDLVEVLLEVAPTLGMARLVPATVELAAALGYDLDEAFEHPARRDGAGGGFSVGA